MSKFGELMIKALEEQHVKDLAEDAQDRSSRRSLSRALKSNKEGHCQSQCHVRCGKPILLRLNPLETNFIDAPGNYILCQDTTMAEGGNINRNFIRITADDVTLDLNGRHLTGLGGADGFVGDTKGIRVEANNVTIRNGTISDFAFSGIRIGSNIRNLRVENIHFERNGKLAFSSPGDIINSASVKNLTIDSCTSSRSRGSFYASGLRGDENVVIQNCNISNMRGGGLFESDSPDFEDLGSSCSVFYWLGGNNTQGQGLVLRNINVSDCASTIVLFGLFTFFGVGAKQSLPDSNYNGVTCENVHFNNLTVSPPANPVDGFTEIRGFGVEFALSAVRLRNCSVTGMRAGNANIPVIPTNRCTAFNVYQCKNVLFENCTASDIRTSGTGSYQPVGFGVDNPTNDPLAVVDSIVYQNCIASDIQNADGPAFGFYVQRGSPVEGDEKYRNIVYENCKALRITAGEYEPSANTPESAGFGIQPDNTDAEGVVYFAEGFVLRDNLAQDITNGHGFLLGETTRVCTVRDNTANNCDKSGFKDTNVAATGDYPPNLYINNRTYNNVRKGGGLLDYDVFSVDTGLNTLIEYTVGAAAPLTGPPLANVSCKHA